SNRSRPVSSRMEGLPSEKEDRAKVELRAVIRGMCRALGLQGTVGLADAELLDRFVRQRDEAAFEVLLWRHGGMGLGVCERVLRDRHAAEDAFQATFLTLARKAATIARGESVAGWLYRVAHRIALRARGRAADRARHERQGPDVPDTAIDLEPGEQ